MKKFKLKENYDIYQNNDAMAAGSMLYEYIGCTYGCIDDETETPCTIIPMIPLQEKFKNILPEIYL